MLRKRNIGGMRQRVEWFKDEAIEFKYLTESYQGWQAYTSWANTHKLKRRIKEKIVDAVWEKV
ncbi:MAG: hypothetical protein ABIG28_00965 [archaeon]